MTDRLTILQGDCLDKLRELPDGSVQCVVTSPPYWGLRSYLPKGHADKHREIGTEKTPLEYVETMRTLFRELWRVLRKDGTVWLNLGDTYFGSGQGFGDTKTTNKNHAGSRQREKPKWKDCGLRPKNLCMIPERVAIALQSDGWYVRSKIPWIKPNSMPSSVDDRPNSAVEYFFLLTKSADYFYDDDAVLMPYTKPLNRWAGDELKADGESDYDEGTGQNRYRDRNMRPNSGGRNWRDSDMLISSLRGLIGNESSDPLCFIVNTSGTPEAHFATFPPELIKPCILAGTSAQGCCSECGSPWERIVEKGAANEEHKKASGADTNGEYNGHSTKNHSGNGVQDASAVKARILEGMRERITTGWKPTCGCPSTINHQQSTVPCTVLDPFGGSGTTGEVAIELGRKAILIELNPSYIELIKRRCDVTPGLALA